MCAMPSVRKNDILAGFKKLDLKGQRVVIHSSLRSFGHVEGGARTVIDAAQETFSTILMPAFSWDSNTAPPLNDRPSQNGCDYAFYDNWSTPLLPFCVESAGIEKSMGCISRFFLIERGVLRSDHPWHSWAAWGDRAKEIISDHPWTSANKPLEKLTGFDGWVVLLGVDLRSCTAIHIAEEKAGRKPFIRWAADRNGMVRRVMTSGCGKGFHRLMPYLRGVFLSTTIGSSIVLTAPLAELIYEASKIIARNPSITRCSETCIRCRDAALGGPKDVHG